MVNDPISRIEWLPADSLQANDYNPNVVQEPELKLLERSILKTGWVQPILISRDRIVIDGFHRTMLSRESKALQQRYNGLAPCVVMDVPPEEAIILTVRMNRAKGTHVAVRMHGLVRRLIDTYGLDPQQIAAEIGATRAEVDLLYQEDVFAVKNIKNYRYSQAWAPAENGIRGGKREV